MHEIPAFGIEARRWTVVFHRTSKHWFFRTIAMGHFKHVSALAWIPELGQWLVYDVGFRRTSLTMLVDGPNAQATIAAIVKDNAAVTIDVRQNELPWFRLGMFCTTAVSHLIGVRCAALRPDALCRHLRAKVGPTSTMQSDQPQAQIAVDPNLATEQAQAQDTLIKGLQTQAQGDTAALMARYGTRLALAGTTAAAPLAAPQAA